MATDAEFSNIYIKSFFVLLSTTGEVVCTRKYGKQADEAMGAMDHAALASFATSANNFVKYVTESKAHDQRIATKAVVASDVKTEERAVLEPDVHEYSFQDEIYSFLMVGEHMLVVENGKGVGLRKSALSTRTQKGKD